MNLICNQLYEWQGRYQCSSDNVGEWSASSFFTTAVCPDFCSAPESLLVSNIMNNSATLTFSPVEGALEYLVRWRAIGGSWTYELISNTSLVVSNLYCNQNYAWQVRVNCDTSVEQWSEEDFFNTLNCEGPCPSPNGLAVINITQTSGIAQFNYVSGNFGYEIRVREVGTPTWNYVPVAINPSSLIGSLECEKQYEWGVRTICDFQGNTSEWSPTVTFNTLPCTEPCEAPIALQISNISSNSALLSYVGTNSATGHQIRYRKLDEYWSLWKYGYSTNNTFLFEELDCHSAYEVIMKTDCGFANKSSWTSSIYFTTLDCGGLTVNEFSKLELVIYPNPSEELLNLEVNQTGMAYSIFDSRGRMVISGQIDGFKEAVSVSTLTYGVYQLMISDSKNSRISGARFIKK